MTASDPNTDPLSRQLDGLLELAGLCVADERLAALDAATGSAAAEHEELREAACGWEPEMVFDPRWD